LVEFAGSEEMDAAFKDNGEAEEIEVTAVVGCNDSGALRGDVLESSRLFEPEYADNRDERQSNEMIKHFGSPPSHTQQLYYQLGILLIFLGWQ